MVNTSMSKLRRNARRRGAKELAYSKRSVLRPKIEEHDLQAKIKTTKKLLEEGNKVRLVLRFRGREVIYPELGRKVLRKVTEAAQEIAIVSNSANEGNSIVLVLSPVSQKKSKETGTDAKT